ncbi:hypothetical protein EDB83DRAFT_2320969 [Lactarius deliciosus]|nr:hypothetical protein EDB83DRAFT_2320969 [Lactarius deliciosus]
MSPAEFSEARINDTGVVSRPLAGGDASIVPCTISPSPSSAPDELPSTVKSLNDSWLATYQSSTVMAGLSAVIEVHLLSFIKIDANPHRNVVGNSANMAFLIFTYLGLFFSVSAAVSGLILMVHFGQLPVWAARARHTPLEFGLFDNGTRELLQSYGAKRSWIWAVRYWLFSLIAGTVSLIIQLLVYVWLEESKPVRIALTVIVAFAVLPLVHLIPLSSGRGKH